MARITIDIYDYAYFQETCLDRYNLKEVGESVHGCSSEITIEGERSVIEHYLHNEYMVGMDEELKAETLESIED